MSRILDNLQVSLTNIHIRVENVDTDVENNQFSLGVTLSAIELYTTDKNWQRKFIDRSSKKDEDSALYKMLQMKNFGIYYKTKEKNLLCLKPENELAPAMQVLSKINKANGRLTECEDAYLVEPIVLEIKLVQHDIVHALEQMLPLFVLNV